MSLTLLIGLFLGEPTWAHRLIENMPVCADILLARPEPSASAPDRATQLIALNVAIAQLKAELARLPKGIGPHPDLPEVPEFDTGDYKKLMAQLKAHGKESDRFLRKFKRRTPDEVKVHWLRGLMKQFEELRRLVDVPNLDQHVEAFRLVGKEEIDAYLDRIASGECLVTFEPTLRDLRPSAGRPFLMKLEKFEVAIRRKRARIIKRHDTKCAALFPERDGQKVADDLRRFWDGQAQFSSAYVTETNFSFSRDFLDAFTPKPDLSRLGWNGREDERQFLARRRAEVMAEQIRYIANFGRGTNDAATMAEHNFDVTFYWIPSQTEEPGAAAPVLTVFTQVKRDDSGSSFRRRRAVEAAAPASEADWAPGLVPAR